MRHTKSISISLIQTDRLPINPKTLGLIDYLRSGGAVPPIKIIKLPQGGYRVKDGRHRLVAFKMIGLQKIEARFSDIPIYKSNK